MKFMSTGYNFRLTVTPAYYRQVGPNSELVRGKAVQFSGPRGGVGFWDSEQAAKAHNWSEEDRLMVERFLLTHDSFGKGIMLGTTGVDHATTAATIMTRGARTPVVYLAPGQEIPAEHADLREQVSEALGTTEPVEAGCSEVILKDTGPELCKRKAKADSIYCAQHAKKHAAPASDAEPEAAEVS